MSTNTEAEVTSSVDDTPQEVEMAARTFASNINDLDNRIDSLSLKEAKRVLKAIVKFPLQDDSNALLVHKTELDVFERCMELMAAKSIMVDHVRRQEEQRIAKEQENGKSLDSAE